VAGFSGDRPQATTTTSAKTPIKLATEINLIVIRETTVFALNAGAETRRVRFDFVSRIPTPFYALSCSSGLVANAFTTNPGPD
jgi:hypothetical protein